MKTRAWGRGFAGKIRRLGKDDEALAITEYAMLVAFAALVLIAVVSIFGSQISSWLTARTGTITTV